MKIHSTNYQNTFIEVAEDCPATKGEVPPMKNDVKTVAAIQFEMIRENPYQFTSDDVLFQVYAEKNAIPESEYAQARALFFSKGQACFRASPLTKRYGWGVHHDETGKIAIFGMETPEYQAKTADESLKKIRAMKSSR